MGRTRRDLLSRIGAAGSASLALGAGCVGRPVGGSDGGSDDGVGSLDIAFQAPAETTDVNTWLGAERFAPNDYELSTSIDVFEGIDLAVQSVLGGEADMARGSIPAAASIIAAGRPFEFVMSPVETTDYVLVTRPGIESLADIVEQDAVIGMSAPTGLDAVQVAAVMLQAGVIDSIDRLNFQRVGYSSARRTAIRNGEIDVSPQHFVQWLGMRSANPDLNRLLTFGERLDRWVQEAFMIPRETLERKRPEITAFIKGQLRANRALYDGFDRYRSIVERYVPGGGPGTDVLRPTYEFLSGIDIWPLNGGLRRSDVDFMLGLSRRLGVTDERIPTDEVFRRGPLDDALGALGRV